MPRSVRAILHLRRSQGLYCRQLTFIVCYQVSLPLLSVEQSVFRIIQWAIMKYVLVLLFACGRGCGSPAEVSLPTRYETLQLCLIAGNAWLSPRANPTRAVKDFRCKPAQR
jgi:hypothetical protein